MADTRGMRVAATLPERILVTGDWHGDQAWALHVIKRVPELLAAERTRLVLQLGDFGIWPGRDGQRYLAAVGWALDQVDAQLWFIDGNHEDFTLLDAAAADATVGDGRVRVAPGIGRRNPADSASLGLCPACAVGFAWADGDEVNRLPPSATRRS